MIKALMLLPMLMGIAHADAPCPEAPKPHKPRHHKPKVKPPVTPEKPATPCACNPGKDGKDGKDGTNGRNGRDASNVLVTPKATPGLSMRLGLMGAVYTPRTDWAWGPGIQLAQPVLGGEIVVDVGLAFVFNGYDWSAGREGGLLLHAGYAHDVKDGLGLTAGIHSTMIAGSSSNGNVSGNYLGLDAGIVLHNDVIRVELTPVLSGLRDGTEPGTQLALGFAGSVFVGF